MLIHAGFCMQTTVVDPQCQALAERMKALGHPVRVGIMNILRREPECVCHLEAALQRPQPYLSQQLRVLREAGLISDQRDGTNVYYRVSDDVATWLQSVLGPLDDDVQHQSDAGAAPTRSDATEAGLPAGRLGGCPCPKCRTAQAECGCSTSILPDEIGSGA